jgi:hypothetical protein
MRDVAEGAERSLRSEGACRATQNPTPAEAPGGQIRAHSVDGRLCPNALQRLARELAGDDRATAVGCDVTGPTTSTPIVLRPTAQEG